PVTASWRARRWKARRWGRESARNSSATRRGRGSIACGKLSAYRAMAERVVDLVVERTGAAARACATADVPLPGGEAAPD
ncbi:hypothetical protein RNI00_30430, partial [Pseudomonas aeruginosa]|uniref:hypothetical protein n=1 Tax=Pseudomonas aeruginosa TaxID=287 RepID=UPI0028865AC4